MAKKQFKTFSEWEKHYLPGSVEARRLEFRTPEEVGRDIARAATRRLAKAKRR